ncbi:hypothetical protein AB0I37_26355 [Micromonospora purpureochromogenes]|uniref:hypothetical protein n=1 Tax=Micromonospora purpureochromogenes TaxID=47872 RepID=UPI0033C9EA41
MGVRSGRLKPLALRLGLVLGVAACAWIGYEAGDDRSARAADAPPVVTVDAVVGGVTGLLQGTLSPAGTPPSVAPNTPDPPRRPGSVDDGRDKGDKGDKGDKKGGKKPSRAGSSPATDTHHATPPPKRRTAPPAGRPTRSVPPRPGTSETEATRASRPPRDRVATPPSAARVATPPSAAVDRVATPVVGGPPAVLDPVTGPVLGALPPVVDPLLRGLHPVLKPLKPALKPLKPVLKRLKPVLKPLKLALGSLRPAKAVPPAGREPGADGTARQAPTAAGTVGRPSGAATTAPPTPSATVPPTGPPRTDAALADTARTRAAWSAAGAGTDPVSHPGRPDVIPHRGAPATDTGGVGSAGGGHQPAADASTVTWTPPATGLRRCRPDGPAPLPSRCPRPGSRPA